MNIRFKITLLFSLLVLCVLSIIGYSIYYFTDTNRQETFQLRLETSATNRAYLFSILETNPVGTLRKIDNTTIQIIKKRALVIIDESNNPVYEFHDKDTRALSISMQQLEKIKKEKKFLYKSGDISMVGIAHEFNHQKLIVFYAGEDEDGLEQLITLKKILLFSLLVGVVLTLIVGYIFSSQLVRPIKQIVKEVNDISFNNLSDRINRGKNQDELSGLANTFNELLNRLQESASIQRRFISNASHELSTPLTSMSSQLQVTLQKDRSPEEYFTVLQSLQEDVEQMRQLTKSLLDIAKTGYEGGLELSEVRIDEIMLRIVGNVKKLNSVYEVELEFGEFPDNDKSSLTYGNAELLYSALKNIVENGCKFSPGKQVFVSLGFEKGTIIVYVKNYGRVIPEREVADIFHPFFRGSATKDTKGFGLGLALSKRIIALHKGSISVKSSATDGTVFTIVLPSLASY